MKGPATLALLGLRASGKSTVGRWLAERLGRPFLDLDDLLLEAARRAGRREESAGKLLAEAGPAEFRAFEAEALRRVLEPGLEVVLATGGGVLERADKLLSGLFPRSGRLVVVHPGMGGSELNWPENHWLELVQKLAGESAINVAVTGTDGERELVKRVILPKIWILRAGKLPT